MASFSVLDGILVDESAGMMVEDERDEYARPVDERSRWVSVEQLDSRHVSRYCGTYKRNVCRHTASENGLVLGQMCSGKVGTNLEENILERQRIEDIEITSRAV